VSPFHVELEISQNQTIQRIYQFVEMSYSPLSPTQGEQPTQLIATSTVDVPSRCREYDIPFYVLAFVTDRRAIEWFDIRVSVAISASPDGLILDGAFSEARHTCSIHNLNQATGDFLERIYTLEVEVIEP
jgi:hypothetical protein